MSPGIVRDIDACAGHISSLLPLESSLIVEPEGATSDLHERVELVRRISGVYGDLRVRSRKRSFLSGLVSGESVGKGKRASVVRLNEANHRQLTGLSIRSSLTAPALSQATPVDLRVGLRSSESIVLSKF